jgi:hypothetical protein
VPGVLMYSVLLELCLYLGSGVWAPGVAADLHLMAVGLAAANRSWRSASRASCCACCRASM